MASKLNKPIDLSEVKRVRTGRIARIGLELEGGWDRLPDGLRLVGDGSVSFSGQTILHKGELNSHPMTLSEVEGWLKQCYPHHVNKTCGMHVHMSTIDAAYYQMLMRIEYPSTVLKYIREWAQENLPDDHFIWPRSGHRYTVINYCWRRYNTLECRLLPMMPTPELATNAVKELVNITERFLVASAEKEEKLQKKVEVAEQVLVESFEIGIPKDDPDGRYRRVEA
jgi:hypothetical protein